MQNKSLHRNIIPVTAIAAAGVLTSQVEMATWGKGLRLYITVTGAVAGGGTDALFLCGVVPGTGIPGVPAVIVPIAGFSLVNQLSVNGVYTADFYPGAWLPPALAPGGSLLGAVGIYLPMKWAVQLRMGAGNSAGIQVDGEMLP